ncbi:hypothetical protein [Massilia sp. TWR1-2-2]|uniref:hypothetical protein n=1 Tax=Massilia sp. TWR1-2-2 TaxID=2804584 RepID=UPI003CEAC62D
MESSSELGIPHGPGWHQRRPLPPVHLSSQLIVRAERQGRLSMDRVMHMSASKVMTTARPWIVKGLWSCAMAAPYSKAIAIGLWRKPKELKLSRRKANDHAPGNC